MSWVKTQNCVLQSRHGSRGQFHGIPRPFIWKISPVEGVLKWEVRLHDKSHVEEMKSFPVAFLLAQNWTGAAITPTPKGHILRQDSKVPFWQFTPAPVEGCLAFRKMLRKMIVLPCTRGRMGVAIHDYLVSGGNGSWYCRFGNGGNGLSSLSILFLSLLLYSYLQRYITLL